MRKYSIILLLLFVAGLYLFQNKAIIPLVMKAVSSKPFTGNPEEGGQPTEVHNDKTTMASIRCNEYVKENLQAAELLFPETDYHTWDIGFGRYMIKSYVDIQPSTGAPSRKNFVCKIEYTGGDIADPDNWSLSGLEILQGP